MCDTLGFGIPFENAGDPYGIPEMVKRLKEIGAENIETHVHDDFGFGTATSIAGFWHGANWSNLTFLGMGERAGNAELEKVLLFLVQRVEGFQKYDLTCLREFAEYVEENLGIRVPRNKAAVGSNIFAHESGIHTAGVIKNPYIYEPYPPELVGGKRSMMIGPTSGTGVVRLKVEEVLTDMMRLETNRWKKPTGEFKQFIPISSTSTMRRRETLAYLMRRSERWSRNTSSSALNWRTKFIKGRPGCDRKFNMRSYILKLGLLYSMPVASHDVLWLVI